MTSRPILFRGEMVRAILDGRKSQTRRAVKYIPALGEPEDWCQQAHTASFARVVGDYRNFCPHGTAGDQLWVRENVWEAGRWHQTHPEDDEWKKWGGSGRLHFASDGNPPNEPNCDYPQGLREGCGSYSAAEPSRIWRHWPSIHMRQKWSRITLQVTDVRVERLNAISAEDAIAEGIRVEKGAGMIEGEDCYMMTTNSGYMRGKAGAIAAYKNLWESINGAGSWALTPWVWVVAFKRIE